ncbi:MAG: RNA-binding protein [Candidatus Sumerlaeota bacterium]|nr:RNA-binding protein [Candidatus Sumerlaeota bacterium]
MSKKLYVGNLPYHTSEEEIRNLFSQYGDVKSVTIIVDRATNRSRGFGFVEIELTNPDTPLSSLEGLALQDRTLKVSEARERQSRG